MRNIRWLVFIVKLCRQLLCDFRRKPYISTFQTNLGNLCLSVILEFRLSSVFLFHFAPAYTILCRGLEYLLKAMYINLVDTNDARFLIFKTVLSGQFGNTALYLKNTSHKRVAFAFGRTNLHIHSQYIHFDILTCKTWLQVMEHSLIYCLFYRYFHTFLTTIHVWCVVSLPNFHRLCVLSIQQF